MKSIGKFLLAAALLTSTFSALPASAAPSSDARVAQYGRGYRAPVIGGMAFLNGKSSFVPGEVIRVVLNGTPGGSASFDIVGIQQGIPMREVQAGRYEGRLRVQNGMQATNTQLVGHLMVNGRQSQYVAAGGVTVGYDQGYNQGYNQPYNQQPYGYNQPYAQPGYGYNQGPVFVNVEQPAAGQPVGRDFMVTGRTVPGAQVNIAASVRRDLIPGIVNLGTQTVNGAGVADPSGYFRIPMHMGGNAWTPNNNINLKVVATDPRTSTSRTVEYSIATGGY